MNRLDLEALAAPIANLRSEVVEAYKRVDAQWSEVEKTLSQLTLPCTITKHISQHDQQGLCYTALEWRKHKGSRRICLTRVDEHYDHNGIGDLTEEVTPIDEWSAEQKLNMLQFVPKLFEAGAEQVKRFIARSHPKVDQ